MKKNLRSLFVLTLAILFCFEVKAQKEEKEDIPAPVNHTYKPIVLNLNEDGSKYLRLIMWHQIWIKATENNPGTADVNGNASRSSFDIGLRRSRMLAMAQVSPRFLILTHFGINNHTFVNGGADGTNKKPGMFIHDAWTEYAVVQNKLHIGAGLHYWNGISRMSNASTLNSMTLDAPIFNWPTIELTDQFARQYGIYAKGKLGKLDYRMALNQPFASGAPTVEGRATNHLNDNLATQGYFNYQFLGQESNALPFAVGTYLGAKEIFNIGFGFHRHPKATASLQNGEKKLHNIMLLGADVFYEKNVGRYSISSYTAFYNYDFGPNYIRNVGIMNSGQRPAADSPQNEFLGFNGPGNAQPTIGTGTIAYSQFGLLLPKFGNGARVMPYVTYTKKNFDMLKAGSHQYDVGLNYFINGHNAKITAQYGVRPLYNASMAKDGHAGEFILQTHIFL